jgi:hypothetical protein
MKVIAFPLLAFLLLLLLSSCIQSYTCGIECDTFQNGTIKICEASGADAAAFSKSTDSLCNLYGTYIVNLSDTVSVSGTSQGAINAIVSQLQQQGYTCNANTTY